MGYEFKAVAPSLETLRLQLNELFPNRSKVSDGGVGDLRHQNGVSDHNPDEYGIVRARDFTFDNNPLDGLGIDCNILAKVLVTHKDKRIKYIIWNRQICASYPAKGKPAWTWRPYTGKNPHKHHLHLSVHDEPSIYNQTQKWNLNGLVADIHPSKIVKLSDTDTSVKSELVPKGELVANAVIDTNAEEKDITGNLNNQESTNLEVKDGNISLQTSSSNALPVEENIAIVKKESPLKNIGGKIVGAVTGTGAFDTLMSYFAQIKALDLPTTIWTNIFWIALIGLVIYFIVLVYLHFQNKRTERHLMEANKTPNNIVTLVKPEEVAPLQALGYKVVTV